MSVVLTSKDAAEFLKIEGKSPERVIEKMARTGQIRGFLPSRKQGWRFHIKALEDALLLGRLK